jgi:hypothetical protein
MKYLMKARPSPAMIVALIALFVALSGTAVALNGSNTVQSDDLGPGAQVRAEDVATNAIGSGKVVNESLTGADVKNQSGVDTCVAGTVRLGQLCVRGENQANDWLSAGLHCANLDLRLPSVGEALELATTHDIPNADDGEYFWTETRYEGPDGFSYAQIVADSPAIANAEIHGSRETVCVTTPTN